MPIPDPFLLLWALKNYLKLSTKLQAPISGSSRVTEHYISKRINYHVQEYIILTLFLLSLQALIFPESSLWCISHFTTGYSQIQKLAFFFFFINISIPPLKETAKIVVYCYNRRNLLFISLHLRLKINVKRQKRPSDKIIVFNIDKGNHVRKPFRKSIELSREIKEY